MAAMSPFEIFGLKPQSESTNKSWMKSILKSRRRFIPTVLPRQATLKSVWLSNGQR